MKIGVLGATGRTGRLVVEEVLAAGDLALHAAVARRAGEPAGPLRTTSAGPGAFAGCDVVVDFSLPGALLQALPHLAGLPLVSGTTGLDAAQEAALDAHAARAPLFRATNFSVGVAVLAELVARAAAALPDADVEIVEVHHRGKRDAPSGTARTLADAVERARGELRRVDGRSGLVGARPPGELGLHAVRGGDVVGEHTVHLLADGERLALGHVATSRRTFALGALRAARWIAGRGPGRVGMAELLADPAGPGAVVR